MSLITVKKILGLDSGCTVKYTPLPSGVSLGFALGNSGEEVYLNVHPSSCPNMDTVLYLYCDKRRDIW